MLPNNHEKRKKKKTFILYISKLLSLNIVIFLLFKCKLFMQVFIDLPNFTEYLTIILQLYHAQIY